jgi:hypothetical protein
LDDNTLDICEEWEDELEFIPTYNYIKCALNITEVKKHEPIIELEE